MRVLGLDVSGTPRSWLTFEDAIMAHAKGNVAWSWGDHEFVARGGYQKDGRQSIIRTKSIIAVKAENGFAIEKVRKEVVLSNKTLFGRDRNTCAYCGKEYHAKSLSRDHIVPKSRGGLDKWMNVVCSCKNCNNYKDNQLLSECGLELRYLPYVPNHAEKLLLEGHNVLADQMEFLRSRLPKNSRLL